jgi:rare lipoprotein A
MSGSGLVDLSPGAAAQLGIAGQQHAAVRVRRVNPPEVERAMLRTGNTAPLRIDTPKSLLAVLSRKLDAQNGILAPAPKVLPEPEATPVPVPAPRPIPAPTPTARPVHGPIAQTGSLIVQVAAFSSQASAATLAHKLGAQASQSGRLWRVRMGPYSAQNQAAAALAKARAAGYSDARIQRAD